MNLKLRCLFWELVSNYEVPAAWVHPRCTNAHNCLRPTLGRWCFLRLYICSLASPRMTAVWQGFWNRHGSQNSYLDVSKGYQKLDTSHQSAGNSKDPDFRILFIRLFKTFSAIVSFLLERTSLTSNIKIFEWDGMS